MDNATKINAVEFWQETLSSKGMVHPLTCSGGGGPGNHQSPMEASLRNNEVVLVCPTCGYVQEPVPPFVYELYEDGGTDEAGVFKARLSMFTYNPKGKQ